MSTYVVVIEEENGSFGAYVPDLPGCTTVGSSRAEVEAQIREAIAGHLETMRELGEPIPEPSASATYVEAA